MAPGGSARRRFARRGGARSAHDVVVRGAVLLALVLQAAWIGGNSLLWPWRQDEPAQAVALYAVAGAWALVAVAQVLDRPAFDRATRLADVLALAAAAVLALTAVMRGSPWSAASDLAVMCAAIGGLLVAPRLSVLVVGVVVAVESAVVVVAGTAPTDVLYPALTVVVGVASISARAALVREASVVDAAWEASNRLEAERRIRSDVEGSLRQFERGLHGAVLPALTSIERGGQDAEMRGRRALRCREAATVLRSLVDQASQPRQAGAVRQDLGHDLAGVLAGLRSAGADVVVDVDPMDDVPPAVFLAVRAAAHEALANTLRHAGAAHCTVAVRVTGTPPAVAVEGRIEDDGAGFDPGAFGARSHLSEAIDGPMREVGGTSTLTSAPGAGTAVGVSWQGSPQAPAPAPYRPSAVRLAVPTLIAFGLLATVSAVATIGSTTHPALDVLALGTMLSAFGLVVAGLGRGALSTPVVVLAIGLGVGAYALQNAADAQSPTSWADWASLALAMLFFVIAGVGPRWAWAVVLVVWVLVQGDVVTELTSPGTAVLVAGALYGRSTRRNTAAVEQARASERAQTVGLAVADESVRRTRGRYAPLAASDAIVLLDGVAAGTLDVDDAAVRRRAAVEAQFVRNLTRVDPQADPLRAVVVDVMVAARRRDVLLTCDVHAAQGHPAGLAVLRASLVSAVDLAVPGSDARLVVEVVGDDVVLRLTLVIEPGRTAAAVALAMPGFPVEPPRPDGQRMQWQWRERREADVVAFAPSPARP